MEQENTKRDLRLLSEEMENLEEFIKTYEEHPVYMSVDLKILGGSSWGDSKVVAQNLEPDTLTEITFALQNDLERKKLRYKELLEQELTNMGFDIDED